MCNGWIKLHRSMLDCPELKGDPNAKAVWIELLLRAAYRPTRLFWRGQSIRLTRGSLVISTRELAEQCGVSYQQLRTILRRFERAGMITSNAIPNAMGTHLTICNYDRFQDIEDNPNAAATQWQRTEQEGKNQRIKNQTPTVESSTPREEAGQARQRAGRAASDRPEFEVWFDRYPKQTGRDAAAEEYRKARRRVSAAKLLEGLEAAIARWTEAGTEARFIPDPANWLRAGRWDDKPPVAPQLELPVLSAVPGAPETFLDRCKRLGKQIHWVAEHHHQLGDPIRDHMDGRLTDDHLLACFGWVAEGLSARSIRRVA